MAKYKIPVILKKDIKNLGKKFEVIKVKPGFARNYLFPKKLALPYVEPYISLYEKEKEKERKRQIEERKKLEQIFEKIKGKEIKIKMRTGLKGELYEKIDAKKIANFLKEKEGIDLKEEQVILKEPIQKAGEYKIKIKLADDLKTRIFLKIEK